MNPIKRAWRWFTLKDLHTEALSTMLPPGHTAWIFVSKENGSERYSACCGEHLMLGLESFCKALNEPKEWFGAPEDLKDAPQIRIEADGKMK